MAAPTDTDLKDRYKEKLGVGTFASKQAIDFVISMGSMAVGAVAGYFIDKNTYKKPLDGSFITEKEGLGAMIPRGGIRGAVVGGLLGSTIGQFFQGYDRWRKHEAERMAVEEINRDIAGFEAMRQKPPAELVEENARLREMLAIETAKTKELQAGRKILEEGPKKLGESRADHVEGSLGRA